MWPPPPLAVMAGAGPAVSARPARPAPGAPLAGERAEAALWTELEDTLDHLGYRPISGVLDGMQRWHYEALFALRFPLRHKATASVVISADVVRRHMVRLAQARVWRRVYANVRLTVRARRKVLRWVRRRKEDRTATLECWLKYWCDCEDRSQHRLRLRCLDDSPTARDRAAPTTDDDLKVYVLWDLYWLLHLRHCRDLEEYHNDLLQLRKQLADARLKDQPTAPILARLFVRFLQAPRFPREPGTDVRFADLLHLSAAQPTTPPARSHGASVAGRLPAEQACCCPGHQTYLAFLSSPLCTHREWLKSRHELPLTMIPPLRWIPASFATIHHRTGMPRLPSCPSIKRASVAVEVPRDLVKCLSFGPGSMGTLLKRRLAAGADLDTASSVGELSPRLRRPPTVPNLRPLLHPPATSSTLVRGPPLNTSFSHIPGSIGPHIPLIPLALSSPRHCEQQSSRKTTARLTHRGKSFHTLGPLGARAP